MLREVATKLELPVSPKSMSGWIDAEVVEGTLILQISVTHPDPALAASIANTVAQVFIRYIQEQRLNEVRRLQARASSFGMADPSTILSQHLTALGSFTHHIRRALVPDSPLTTGGGGGGSRGGPLLPPASSPSSSPSPWSTWPGRTGRLLPAWLPQV